MEWWCVTIFICAVQRREERVWIEEDEEDEEEEGLRT
jgi:hypothetical protein